MSNLTKGIWEHLKTKKKYNKLNIKYKTLQEIHETKLTEIDIQKMIFRKRQEIWEQTLKEQEEEIIRLKKRGVKKNVSKPKRNLEKC